MTQLKLGKWCFVVFLGVVSRVEVVGVSFFGDFLKRLKPFVGLQKHQAWRLDLPIWMMFFKGNMFGNLFVGLSRPFCSNYWWLCSLVYLCPCQIWTTSANKVVNSLRWFCSVAKPKRFEPFLKSLFLCLVSLEKKEEKPTAGTLRSRRLVPRSLGEFAFSATAAGFWCTGRKAAARGWGVVGEGPRMEGLGVLVSCVFFIFVWLVCWWTLGTSTCSVFVSPKRS